MGFLPQTSAELGIHLCSFSSQFIDLSPRPGWTPSTTAATPNGDSHEEAVPPGSLARLLDTDTGNQLVSFNAAAGKSLILTDLYLDSLSFIFLRISVYLLDRAPSSPIEATIEPWKTTKSKGCAKKKKIHSICNTSIKGA